MFTEGATGSLGATLEKVPHNFVFINYNKISIKFSILFGEAPTPPPPHGTSMITRTVFFYGLSLENKMIRENYLTVYCTYIGNSKLPSSLLKRYNIYHYINYRSYIIIGM